MTLLIFILCRSKGTLCLYSSNSSVANYFQKHGDFQKLTLGLLFEVKSLSKHIQALRYHLGRPLGFSLYGLLSIVRLNLILHNFNHNRLQYEEQNATLEEPPPSMTCVTQSKMESQPQKLAASTLDLIFCMCSRRCLV